MADETRDLGGIYRDRSFWFDTAEPYAPAGPLRGAQRFDVCIVGGGVTGLSTAYHLMALAPATKVCVLEAEIVGYGASGRNAGQLVVQFGGGANARHLRKYGANRVSEAWDYVHRGIELIADLETAEGIDCDLAPTGYLKTELKAQPGAVEAYARFLETIGQGRHFQRISPDAVAGMLASPHLGEGLYDARGGQFNPLKLVRGLRRAAERRGARIFEASPVLRLDLTHRDIRIHTGQGQVSADRLVLATNAYTHLLPGAADAGLANQQTPLIVRGTVTEPLSPQQWARLGWQPRCGVNLVSDLFYSFAPTADGRILHVGGYYASAPPDRSFSPEAEWRLKDEGAAHLASFFPDLAGVRTAQTWGGPMSLTVDWVPHIGFAQDRRIVFACGCWGHGMALGAYNGLTLAELCLDRATARTEMWFVSRPKPSWPPRPLTNIVAKWVVSGRRRRSRAVAARLKPPIRFGV